MNKSTLRSKLINSGLAYTDTYVDTEKFIDAILDVLIEAMPEKRVPLKDSIDSVSYSFGYNQSRSDITAILTEAHGQTT